MGNGRNHVTVVIKCNLQTMDGLYGNATVSMHITCKAYLIDTC